MALQGLLIIPLESASAKGCGYGAISDVDRAHSAHTRSFAMII